MSIAVEDLPRRHRITVGEYHHMAETGLIAPDAWVELINGEIIEMPPMGSPHAAIVSILYELLHSAVGSRALIRCQTSIRMGDFSQPQPDLAVVKRPADFYATGHPTPADTHLIIEVSETSLRYDLRDKAPLYAQHGVPETWVLDIEGRRLHVFRNPVAGIYMDTSIVPASGTLHIASMQNVAVDLSTLSSAWTRA